MSEQKTILVVDDEKYLRLSLSLLLKKEGYDVESAGTAEEALDHLQARSWDMMLLDLNMPGMGGIDLLMEVNQKHPSLSVLILTAHATMETAIQAVRLGASDYLIKPAEPKALLARIAEILKQKKQPARKQEIVGEIQNLLAELQKIEGVSVTPPPSAPQETVDHARYLDIQPFVVDLHGRHVTMNGTYIPITGVYFDYFLVLLRHAPKPISFKTLVKEAQGYDVPLTEAKDLARWRVHELRKLIELDPQKPKYLLTVRGSGYRLTL